MSEHELQEPLPTNPLNPSEALKIPASHHQSRDANPAQPPLPGDSAVTRAEKHEGNGLDQNDDFPPAKKLKLEPVVDSELPAKVDNRRKGVASIKPEYISYSCQLFARRLML